jgi:[ribosomal protein S5]-alanine N-acetyltransferase
LIRAVPALEFPHGLSDAHVALREFGRQDSQPYCRAFKDDPALGARLGMESDPTEASFQHQIEQAPGLRANGREIEFAIVDANAVSEGFLGCVVLHSFQWHHRRAEIGAWVVPAARGRGVAWRASTIGLQWAFDTLELERVEATTTPDNPQAQSLALRLGFQREGVMRHRNVERGGRVDLVIFGLLRGEWAQRLP